VGPPADAGRPTALSGPRWAGSFFIIRTGKCVAQNPTRGFLASGIISFLKKNVTIFLKEKNLNNCGNFSATIFLFRPGQKKSGLPKSPAHPTHQ
jgi:hypothetical protein